MIRTVLRVIRIRHGFEAARSVSSSKYLRHDDTSKAETMPHKSANEKEPTLRNKTFDEKSFDDPTLFEDEEDIELEEMFVMGPDGTMEHGGPTRGGKYAEPTRFGDWEKKGRCSDF